MKTQLHRLWLVTGSLCCLSLSGWLSPALAANEPQVIVLTQIACQFLESEGGIDHGFQSESANDCRAINAESGDQRLSQAQPLTLKPGRYIFRVTNRNVPYELGFWLRGKGVIGYAALPRVSGGGLTTGKTQDYAIELEEGEYLYSCPLNPTPNYHLVVES